MITSRSPQRSSARAVRCSSQSSAMRSSTSLCSTASRASWPCDSLWSSSERTSVSRSISALISSRVLMSMKTPYPGLLFLTPGTDEEEDDHYGAHDSGRDHDRLEGRIHA